MSRIKSSGKRRHSICGSEFPDHSSVEDLSPIGLNYLDESNADTASIASASSRLRGRVFQVGELAGSAADSANKVITGVVDSSWTALRGLISAPAASEVDGSSAPAPAERPGMRPRQASTFSLASVTASVATIAAAAANRSRSRANSRASAIMNQHNPTKEEHTWKGNEEMVEVTSRPESVREKNNKQSSYGSSDDEQAETSEDDDDGKGITGINKGDARSIRSVSSVLSKSRSRDAETEREEAKERVSISDRLASIGVLGRISTPPDGSTSSEPLSKVSLRLYAIRHTKGAGRKFLGRHNIFAECLRIRTRKEAITAGRWWQRIQERQFGISSRQHCIFTAHPEHYAIKHNNNGQYRTTDRTFHDLYVITSVHGCIPLKSRRCWRYTLSGDRRTFTRLQTIGCHRQCYGEIGTRCDVMCRHATVCVL